jgi:hypothetical protein
VGANVPFLLEDPLFEHQIILQKPAVGRVAERDLEKIQNRKIIVGDLAVGRVAEGDLEKVSNRKIIEK